MSITSDKGLLIDNYNNKRIDEIIMTSFRGEVLKEFVGYDHTYKTNFHFYEYGGENYSDYGNEIKKYIDLTEGFKINPNNSIPELILFENYKRKVISTKKDGNLTTQVYRFELILDKTFQNYFEDKHPDINVGDYVYMTITYDQNYFVQEFNLSQDQYAKNIIWKNIKYKYSEKKDYSELFEYIINYEKSPLITISIKQGDFIQNTYKFKQNTAIYIEAKYEQFVFIDSNLNTDYAKFMYNRYIANNEYTVSEDKTFYIR